MFVLDIENVREVQPNKRISMIDFNKGTLILKPLLLLFLEESRSKHNTSKKI